MAQSTNPWTLVWNTALPWPLIVGLGIVLGFVLFHSYRKPRRAIPPLTRHGLLGLRSVVLLLLLFFLARPALEGRSGVVEQNRMIVLIDSSRSMTIRDEGSRTRHEALREAWKQSQGPLAELGTAKKAALVAEAYGGKALGALARLVTFPVRMFVKKRRLTETYLDDPAIRALPPLPEPTAPPAKLEA